MRKIKILFVCHGNICRSTISESVLTHLFHQLHLDNQFEKVSEWDTTIQDTMEEYENVER